MARTNKYTSINFNDIFEKKASNKTPSSSSSTSSSSSSSSSVNKTTTRNHGGMLVLTRPTPKPLPQLQPQSQSQSQSQSQTKQPLQSSKSIDHHQSRSEPQSESDPISLRPLGRTGSSSLTPPPSSSSSSSSSPPLITLPQQESVISLKPQPFVPPHLRPGFVGKEEKVFGQNGQRNQGVRSRDIGYGQVQNDGENGRPKSGGGYERMRRGGTGESDLEVMNRPSSSGNRPNSSGGWYGGSSSYRSPSHY